MKEDCFSQSNDYDAPFFERLYRHGSCYMSLFKFKSFNPPELPQISDNCGTKIDIFAKRKYKILCVHTTMMITTFMPK